jgi:hypothetical protein
LSNRIFANVLFGAAFIIWIVFPPLFLVAVSLELLDPTSFSGFIGYIFESVHYTFDQTAVLWGAGAVLAVLSLSVLAIFAPRMPQKYQAILKKKSKGETVDQ